MIEHDKSSSDSDTEIFETPSESLQNPFATAINLKKRPLHKSSSSESPSTPVQKNKCATIKRHVEYQGTKMDDATRKFFENIVKASEERTANLIKTEIASVKNDLSKKVCSLEVEVTNLKRDLQRANSELRKRNLLIEGIPEKTGEIWKDTEQHVKDLFKKIGIPENTEFDECFRIGKPIPGKVRPILLKLMKLRDKRLITSNCKHLKGTKIYVNEDLTKEQRTMNAILRKKQKELKSTHPGATVYIRNGQLLFTNGLTFKRFEVTSQNIIRELPSSSATIAL
jgi:hypothetical protein